jgi:hypothetical protein
VEICGCELRTVPRKGDPSREVGRDIVATVIIITADLSEATNRGFTGPPNVPADQRSSQARAGSQISPNCCRIATD